MGKINIRCLGHILLRLKKRLSSVVQSYIKVQIIAETRVILFLIPLNPLRTNQ